MGTSVERWMPLVAALVLGAVSAMGDWIWARFLTDGAVLPGVIHGVLIFLILAAVLAVAAGTRRAWRRLLPTLPFAGLAIAALFYPLAYAIGYVPALLISWLLMWLSLALLGRWARGSDERLVAAVTRGLIAAVGSGAAFWSVAGMWTGTLDPGPLLRFIYWSWAFLPGFVALLWQWQGGRQRRLDSVDDSVDDSVEL